MNRAEEIQSLLDEFIPRLNALRDDALREVAQAQEIAQANIDRHTHAQAERGEVEEQIARLRSERDSLPDRAYRAGLDEDYEQEDDLKERYRNLKPALEGLVQRAEELDQEIVDLSPEGDSHPNNVIVRQYGKVAGTASAPRHELEALKDHLTKALDASIDPVVKKHEDLKATVWQLGHERSWDESPVGRGGIPA
jgi:predicted  nucleic acid-binding Zn-ribbon protein